jgi:hypothetical protein
MGTSTQKLLQNALDLDPSLTAKMFEAMDAANDSVAAIEEQAMEEDFRHCRLPGE